MLNKVLTKIKELGITIDYIHMDDNGHHGFFNDTPVILINENLNKLNTALALLHETAHFLNEDCEKYIPNHFVNDDIEFKANHYMIYEIMNLLDQEYDFQPDTNYQAIIDMLDLPYHLDGVIIDAFVSILQDKFEIEESDVQNDYWRYG
ncbi:hypothetical protein RyT2_22520 [Pseudolactococcus yaeyamensis]